MEKVGFRERILTTRTYNLFFNGKKENYRWLPENVLGTLSYSVCLDRTYFIHWKMRQALVIRNKALAETFRGQFEFLWLQAHTFR